MSPLATIGLSYTPEVKHSGKEFKTEFEFQSNAHKTIIDSKHHQELVYSDIASLWGINIVCPSAGLAILRLT
jgi:hypothetical protein